jgi:hypothetical protein
MRLKERKEEKVHSIVHLRELSEGEEKRREEKKGLEKRVHS